VIIDMIRVVGDTLCVFEAHAGPLWIHLRHQVVLATVSHYLGGTTEYGPRPKAVKVIRLYRGKATANECTALPLLAEEVSEVLAWIAGAPVPPDEILKIPDIAARRTAWDAWEQASAES